MMEIYAELRDEKWLWNLALLCYLHSKVQVKQKIITVMSGADRSFEMKLKLLQRN